MRGARQTKTEKNKVQKSIFEDTETWKEEWKDMPEFIRSDLDALECVIVNFNTVEDRMAFAKLVDQQITSNTKSIWYPKQKIADNINKRYIDES